VYNKYGRAKKIYTYGDTTDQPISMRYRENGYVRWHTVYYLYDGEGNVRQLTNSRGQVIASYNYLPFGEMMNRGGEGQGIQGNEGEGIDWGRENGFTNTITYQGREYDRDAGLYYYRARYQDLRLGRFLEVDPLLREVPEYTENIILSPTTSLGGCPICGGGEPRENPDILNLLLIPVPPVFLYTPENMLPTFPNILKYPYIYCDNNPINNNDPTGFQSGSGAQRIPNPSSQVADWINDIYNTYKNILKNLGKEALNEAINKICSEAAQKRHPNINYSPPWPTRGECDKRLSVCDVAYDATLCSTGIKYLIEPSVENEDALANLITQQDNLLSNWALSRGNPIKSFQ
jgi:RHS repeat-associated protein